jgi:type III pantothenate kinase
VKADFVVDVGNTRIKWGRCSGGAIAALVALPPDDPATWTSQLASWGVEPRQRWIVSGVAPKPRDALVLWLQKANQHVVVLDSHRQLPLHVQAEAPERVGIDRLLNAVAVNRRRPADRPAVIIDAGSAVTVDWVDADGAFRGGAILPGLRTMAHALHNYTAFLPLVNVSATVPPVPATNTRAAIEAGIFWSVGGGIQTLISKMSAAQTPMVFLGGGDAAVLAPALDPRAILWPEMTLEGIRLAAEALPD